MSLKAYGFLFFSSFCLPRIQTKMKKGLTTQKLLNLLQAREQGVWNRGAFWTQHCSMEHGEASRGRMEVRILGPKPSR